MAEAPSPLVSVVIATYNRWPLLGESIESALAQTFPDTEVVVVDDGSTDGTAAQVRSWFPAVRLVEQENTERGAAFNRGVRAARGAYVSILGSDDVLEPWHVAQFADAERASGPDCIYAGRAWLWDPVSGRKRLQPDFDPGTARRDALTGAVIAPQAMVVSRDAYLGVGGYPEDRTTAGTEDWVLLMKLTNRYEVRRLPSPSVRVREHPGRSMANLAAISAAREAATRLVLEDRLLGYELDPPSARLVAAGTHRLCAAHHYAMGEMGEARARIRAVCSAMGPAAGIRWTGRLWLQTWLGGRGSLLLRLARHRLASR